MMKNDNRTETEHDNVELFLGRYQVEAHGRLALADWESGGGRHAGDALHFKIDPWLGFEVRACDLHL